MNKFITKPKTTPLVKEKYERFNLTDNPFPYDPFMEPESENVRINGTIYNENIKKNEIQKISNNFFLQSLDGNNKRLGYLIDSAYTGRGNGKSALLVHLKSLVNKDFGATVSNQENRVFAIYIKPQPSGRSAKFWQLAEEVLVQISKTNILKEVLITLKYNALASMPSELEKVQDKLQTEEDFYNLLDSSFLSTHNVNEFEVNQSIIDLLVGFKIDRTLAAEMVQMPNSLNQILIERHFKLSESQKRKQIPHVLFDQLVKIFSAANFNGGYILLDEFEKIVDSQSAAERNDFAAELRFNLFEGGGMSATSGFFMMIVAMHPGVPNLLRESWEKSGLNARTPLPSSAENDLHIIFFNNLQKNNIKELLTVYLDHFRCNPNLTDKCGIYPFEESAIEKVAELANYNTAKTLKFANILLDECAKETDRLVDLKFVESIISQKKNNPDEDIMSSDFLKRESLPLENILKGVSINK